MRDDTPTVYLLAGPPRTGKTTYAKALEAQGVVRLTVDPDVDPVLWSAREEINKQIVYHVEAGRDVVLDHGLGEREERDFYKQLVEEYGAQWCLIHFAVDHAGLMRRLEERS